MVDQLLEDAQTIGLANEKIIIKTEQGNAITDVQEALGRARQTYGTALEIPRLEIQIRGLIANAIIKWSCYQTH